MGRARGSCRAWRSSSRAHLGAKWTAAGEEEELPRTGVSANLRRLLLRLCSSKVEAREAPRLTDLVFAALIIPRAPVAFSPLPPIFSCFPAVSITCRTTPVSRATLQCFRPRTQAPATSSAIVACSLPPQTTRVANRAFASSPEAGEHLLPLQAPSSLVVLFARKAVYCANFEIKV